MIRYLNIKKHKGLHQAQLMDLGNINVICGKNNSGKTTVLEALLDKNCYGIGKKLDDVEWLVGLFRPQAERYNDPNPRSSITWFRNHVTSLIQQNTIWFSDDPTVIPKIHEAQKSDSYLRQYSQNVFQLDGVLVAFFEKSLAFYNPVLIPPKRQLEFQSNINLNQSISPTGNGIINELFFLKNQDLESDNYKVYKKIYDTFYEITGSRFNVVPDKKNQIKLFYKTDENWVPASDSGLGLSDVLIMVSICSLVDSNVFLIEEPENHLHAEYQKKLLKYLKSLKSKQFFITTHSSVFLDTNMVDKIFYCCMNNGEIQLSDQTSKSEIINALGYSVTENLVADLIILLEGPTDIPVIKEMLDWLGVNSSFNVKFWALGGDIMASLDLSVFAERNNVFALVDSDPGSSVQRTRFMRNCAESGIRCRKLERYSIENYFTLESIRKVFPAQIPDELVQITPKKPVDVQIGFKDRNKTIKIKNAEIVRHMNVSNIEGTDLHEFLTEIQCFLSENKLPTPGE